MPPILLFDYDGVLVDSLDIFMNHFIKACKNEGFPKIHDKKSFLKLFDKNLYECMLELGMSLETIFNVISQVRDGLLRDQHKLELFPGIYEAIKNIAEKCELFVVTSNDTNVVSSFLASQGLTFFSGIYGSDKDGSKVNKINAIKKLYPDGDLYYIGDTKGDIEEGCKAGVKTIAVTWGWHDSKRLSENKPDHMIDIPDKLVKLFVEG